MMASPGSADQGQQEVIQPNVPGNLPGQDQPNGNGKHDPIDTGRPRHDVVPVHEPAEEGGDTGERTQHEGNTNQQLTISNLTMSDSRTESVSQARLARTSTIIEMFDD
jgi:hypothetical protein